LKTGIGISTRLVQKGQSIFSMSVSNAQDAAARLHTFSAIRDCCLLIDGNSLQICIERFASSFIDIACRAPSVICCRCSPTQKVFFIHNF
jgi:phospholipid-translocating ATPase